MRSHATHSHDARRPYPPHRAASGRSRRAAPLIAGGQGRTDSEIEAEGRAIALCLVCLVLFVALAIALVARIAVIARGAAS